MKNIITKDMVIKGYNQGLINLILSPNGDGIACSIGDNWFYFGGITAEDYNNVEEYKNDILTSEIINEIYKTLENFGEYDEDEFLYYYLYLTENIMDLTQNDKIVILANNAILNALQNAEKVKEVYNRTYYYKTDKDFKAVILNTEFE